MKKIILRGIGLFFSFSVITFAVLVVFSLNYDETNSRDRANSYYIQNSIEIDWSVPEVFHFIQYRIPEIYTDLTDMHDEFTILNAEKLEVGAEIKCIEGDDRDIVHNHYVVTKVTLNKLIQFESTPTIVYDRETKKEMGRMNVYVYFDFDELGKERTLLTQTVVIDMLNPFFKSLIDILAFISGNRGEWEKQFHDELINFKPIIENN